MPSYLRGPGNERQTLTFVKMNTSNLFFGWKAKDLASKPNVGAADLTALGHKTAAQVAAVTGAIAILGANAPRPARFTKILNQFTTSPGVQKAVSTYCAYDAGATALAAGWSPVQSGQNRPSVKATTRTVTAGASVDFGGAIGYYLWPMNAGDAALTQVVALGLKFAGGALTDAEIKKGFSGSSYPRPVRGSLELDNGSKVSAFIPHDKVDDAQTAGWSLESGKNPVVVTAPVTP